VEAKKRELMMRVAWHYLGTPYLWGGDDPSGFDCSGFACECLQSIGLLPHKTDFTAAALYDKFKPGFVDMPWKDAQPGDLIFFKAGATDDRIIHVEIMVDSLHCIGASGGGSACVDACEAWRRNAFIKVRPWDYRPHGAGVLSPFYQRGLRVV
jgi:cell wall-associated NlpC family hydrolase